ncbi:hypothetical protein KEM56_003830, partial [Ascosphaera pollenicola]
MGQDGVFMGDVELMNHYYNASMFDAEGGLQLFDMQPSYPPMPEPSVGLGIYGQTTDFSGFDAPFAFKPGQGDMVGSYAPQAFQLMDVVAGEALAASSGDVQPAPQLAHPPVVPSSQDLNLLEGRRLGLTYKQIKEQYNMPESESTLRGRYRSLTKPKEERVRKPVWLPNDISAPRHSLQASLLKEAVEALRVVHNGTDSVSWVRVAERMRGMYASRPWQRPARVRGQEVPLDTTGVTQSRVAERMRNFNMLRGHGRGQPEIKE